MTTNDDRSDQVALATRAKIKWYMDQMLLNQSDLAAATGLNERTISRLLLGTTKNPRRKTLNIIARGLKVDLEKLLPGNESPRPSAPSSSPTPVRTQMLEEASPASRVFSPRHFQSYDGEEALREIAECVKKSKVVLNTVITEDSLPAIEASPGMQLWIEAALGRFGPARCSRM